MKTDASIPIPASPARPSGERWPWIPDQSDGTCRNPVLCADYSDPDVIRAGNDFYLTASSFNCTPGLPILHSRDLVNWTIINHAVKNLPHPRYAEVQPGCGIWAPAMRFHAGKFWIFPDARRRHLRRHHRPSRRPRVLAASGPRRQGFD